jgi:hypothetical protein
VSPVFDTVTDANQKLVGTVILYNEAPIYVTKAVDHAFEPGKVSVGLKYTHLVGGEEGLCKLTEPEVDFRSIHARLGYMNAVSKVGHKQAIFVQRMAKRLSVQGLASNNLKFQQFDGTPSLEQYQSKFDEHYKQKYFSDMLKGTYPSKAEAADLLLKDKDRVSVAFNRYFALLRKNVGPYFLEYKGREVGWSTNLKKYNLSGAYEHLGETLEYYEIDYALTDT